MKKIDFYFVDQINFHKRNFDNFISFVENDFSFKYNNAYPALKKSFGKYELKKISGLPNFSKYEELFKDLNDKPLSELKQVSYKGYNLWDVIHAEMYAYLTPKIYQLYIANEIPAQQADSDCLLEWLRSSKIEDETFQNLVFYNFAIGAFWIDYWAATLKRVKINNVCVFGGTTIYSRAATLVAQWNNINVLSFEGSFIKDFHYADSASGMITNNHRFADHSKWVRLQGLDFLDKQAEWLEETMANRLNLNVVQPNKLTKEELYQRYNIDPNKKLILLIGQVLNDFSITRDLKNYESSIDFYVNVIKSIADKKDCHLFIKLHPWENHKQNSTTELSKRVLEKKLADHSITNFTVDYDVNIDSLIDFSEIGITSCSQAGLEMLYMGKRVVQVGNAFYGNKGWTVDVTEPEFLPLSIDIALSKPRLEHIELREVRKFIYHLLHSNCFKRTGEDINFEKKFYEVTAFNKSREAGIIQRVNKKLKKYKLKLRRVKTLARKAIKEPKKAALALKYRASMYFSIIQAKMTSKKIVNMVMGQATYSKIFEDMLARFNHVLKDDYLMIVTEKSLKNADVYHYWRPNASKSDIKHPGIVTVHHDFDRDSESLSLRHFIDSYKLGDMILCLNEQQKERISEYLGQSKPIKVIPHGYDTSFKPKDVYKKEINSDNKLVIGFSSRRYPRLIKGEETLYKIIEGLKDQPVKFVFIGQDRKKEQEFCEMLGVDSEVYEKIPYSEFPQLYSQMDLFLITSKAEGGPASLPEALATGLPVVSTPCGFVPDMVTNGQNGYIVDYEDDQAFVKRIEQFIQNPELLEQMGLRALETNNLKSWEDIIKDYIKAYEEVLTLSDNEGEEHGIQRSKGTI
ncbi:glycosyltransferase [Metabacillus sediminilitoris]|uniref:Glycosyltransferase n=1 Tax=Metabacillus sediminilitoris TaxID=2567941 RepID=A0A4S4C1F2_9BACI|nr:glycosyltransferase [Metabacillus sediminilitoris]QGQ48167.1 glycosyltransferase [Metabacillus sediminilitoris]THF81470.1 glycosyltransferase [Metabacillus sediminilitoris]